MGRELRVLVGKAMFGDLACVIECRCDHGDGCYVQRWEAGPSAAQSGFPRIPPPSDELRSRRFAGADEAAAAAYRELLLKLSMP